MPEFTAFGIVWFALTVLVGAVMWAAQVHPDQAVSNLSVWAERLKLPMPLSLRSSLRSPAVDRKVSQWAKLALVILLLIGIAGAMWIASKSIPAIGLAVSAAGLVLFGAWFIADRSPVSPVSEPKHGQGSVPSVPQAPSPATDNLPAGLAPMQSGPVPPPPQTAPPAARVIPSTRAAVEIQRIKNRLSGLYDIINTEGISLIQDNSDFDHGLLEPRLFLRVGGPVAVRARALSVKDKTTKLVEDIRRFISMNSHDSEILVSTLGGRGYADIIYNFRNAVEEYAGSIPNKDQTAEEILNNDSLWSSYHAMRHTLDPFVKWVRDTLASEKGIKAAEADLDRELQNAR